MGAFSPQAEKGERRGWGPRVLPGHPQEPDFCLCDLLPIKVVLAPLPGVLWAEDPASDGPLEDIPALNCSTICLASF